MEFLSRNFYDTTTQIAVQSNTVTAAFIMDSDIRRQYVTSGYADDSITASVVITFAQTQTVGRIALREINLAAFNIFYNGVTANAFTLTGPTTTSQFISNTAANVYLQCTPVACSSLTLDMKKTIVANSEKAVGQLIISANEFTFSRLPSSGDYKPMLKAKQMVHELSTGGTRSHTVDQKWEVKMKFKYIDESVRDDLKEIYDTMEAKIFVPFGTTTSWDGVCFEANWVGDFDFYNYSDNAVASGFTGNIDLKET